MSKRLQVVIADDELERYLRAADAAGLTLSGWARQAFAAAADDLSDGDVEAKLALIRKAASLHTGGREVDIETMLAETETARLADIEASMGTDDV